MAGLLHRLWPRPCLFVPTAAFAADAPAGLVVLSPGQIPSLDYYFRSRPCPPGTLWIDTRTQAPALLPAGALEKRLVVIVRHAPRPWLSRLLDEAPRLFGATFFLDDDLPGAASDPWLPVGYALRTSLRFTLARPLLARLCGRVWAATPALARRYPEAAARVLPPLPYAPLRSPRPASPDVPLTVFYHGTTAHGREKGWLREVAASVQARLPDSVFEISGGPDVARLYAGIPRLRVLPPLSWPEFREHLARAPLHIGLAPLLDSPFNVTRSHTKFLEISGCGAAGVFAAREPYAGIVRQGDTGLLAGADPQAWVEAILRLATDEDLRLSLAEGGQAWAASQPRLWPWEAT